MSLITTITEFKKYIAIDGNTKIATLQPFINEAEQLYIKGLLGPAFYEAYLPLYTASVASSPTPLTPANAALLPYIQRCLAYYAQWLSIDQVSITYGEQGMRTHRADESDTAPRWMQEKLQFNAMRNGDTHADKLLEFLENNAADYTAWRDSAANTKKSGVIVYNATIAGKHIKINNSRRIYLKLYQTIVNVEQRIIKKLVGEEQYTDLVAKLKAGTAFSTAEAALVAKLEPIIAKRALYHELPLMRVSITDAGLFTYSGLDELHKYFASDADVKALRQELKDGEFGYLADERELEQFMEDNIDDYPFMIDSEAYTVQPAPGPTFTPKNDPCNKHFIV